MSVRQNFGMACAKCGRDDNLLVEVSVNALLTANGTDTDRVPDGSANHMWDDNSRVVCLTTGCDKTGAVWQFKVANHERISA